MLCSLLGLVNGSVFTNSSGTVEPREQVSIGTSYCFKTSYIQFGVKELYKKDERRKVGLEDRHGVGRTGDAARHVKRHGSNEE